MDHYQETKQTLQALFDKACAGIIQQGCKSVGEDPSCPRLTVCRYRTKNGNETLKCAVGQILTDDQILKYNITEGKNPADFSHELLEELAPGIKPFTAKFFLKALQTCHDYASDSNFVESFINRANALAETQGLSPIQR